MEIRQLLTNFALINQTKGKYNGIREENTGGS